MVVNSVWYIKALLKFTCQFEFLSSSTSQITLFGKQKYDLRIGGLCPANKSILDRIYSYEVTNSCYAHFLSPAFIFRDDIHKVGSVNVRRSFGKEGSLACNVFVEFVTSLILPQSDFHLFGPMKQHVAGPQSHNNEVNMAAGEMSRMQEFDFYLDGIFKLVPK